MSGIQQTRDEIGTEDELSFIFKRFSEKFNVYQGPSARRTRDVTNDSIWGNGDTWGSDLWQGDYINEPVMESVINIDNRFEDRFDITFFTDTDVTTADDSVEGEVSFTAGEIYQSIEAYKNEELSNIIKATLTVTEDSGSFNYYLWTDSNTPELVTNGSEHTFTNPGTSIFYKVQEATVGWPTAFGTWGSASGGIGTITKTILTYG